MAKSDRLSKCRAPRRGFSLASLLLLTAVAAILAAAAGSAAVRAKPDQVDGLVFGAVLGMIVGTGVGVVVGWSLLGRLRDAALGLVIGAPFGAITGVLIASPQGLPTVVGGSLLLVVVGLVFRFRSDKPPR